jgi:hypothetical protein
LTKATAVAGIVEADETFIRKSSKGSRSLLRRARKRGEKAKPGLSTDDYDPVLIPARSPGRVTGTARPPTRSCGISPRRRSPPSSRRSWRRIACSSRMARDAYGAFAHAGGILHVPIIAARGEYVYEGFHIQNDNAYMSRLKAWMAPFKGVTSKYLENYLGWRRMIERDGDRLTPCHALAAARGP